MSFRFLPQPFVGTRLPFRRIRAGKTAPRVSHVATLALGLLMACGGAAPTSKAPLTQPTAATMTTQAGATTDESAFGPLETGSDYLTYTRVTDAPFLSTVHGNRWVHVYVTPSAAQAYLAGEPMPVGAVVVKTSFENDGGKPSAVAGPLFIMQKRAPGYDPDHDDWYYAIHWANPPAAMRKQFGAMYWRGKSPKVAYCWECNDGYDRSLGGLTPTSLLER